MRPRRWSPRSVGGGGKAVALAADLADEAAVETLLPRAERRRSGRSACLVNNASIFENDTVDTATRESWDAHLAVNLRAPFVLIQDFAALLPADAGGVVINLLDERVWNLTPYFVSYTVSKTGLWTLTRTMALALGAAHSGQRASGPGPTLPSPRQTPEQFLDRCRNDAVAARHQPARDRGGDALHPGGAGDDRPDDRARWRASISVGRSPDSAAGRVE